jgi:hypothetical protein
MEGLRMSRTNGFAGVAIWAFMVAGYFPAYAANGVGKPMEATVCSISDDPTHFAGKNVVVSGQLESDGIERVVLTDKDCDRYGIAISTPEHFAGEESFIKAFSVGHPGTLDKTITGTFIGKFRWQPGKVPKRILVLQEARGVTVAMK